MAVVPPRSIQICSTCNSICWIILHCCCGTVVPYFPDRCTLEDVAGACFLHLYPTNLNETVCIYPFPTEQVWTTPDFPEAFFSLYPNTSQTGQLTLHTLARCFPNLSTFALTFLCAWAPQLLLTLPALAQALEPPTWSGTRHFSS